MRERGWRKRETQAEREREAERGRGGGSVDSTASPCLVVEFFEHYSTLYNAICSPDGGGSGGSSSVHFKPTGMPYESQDVGGTPLLMNHQLQS